MDSAADLSLQTERIVFGYVMYRRVSGGMVPSPGWSAYALTALQRLLTMERCASLVAFERLTISLRASKACIPTTYQERPISPIPRGQRRKIASPLIVTRRQPHRREFQPPQHQTQKHAGNPAVVVGEGVDAQ